MTNRIAEMEPRWIGLVRKAVEGLSYGVVQITVHADQVVQVERTEKFRLDATRSPGPGRTEAAT